METAIDGRSYVTRQPVVVLIEEAFGGTWRRLTSQDETLRSLSLRGLAERAFFWRSGVLSSLWLRLQMQFPIPYSLRDT